MLPPLSVSDSQILPIIGSAFVARVLHTFGLPTHGLGGLTAISGFYLLSTVVTFFLMMLMVFVIYNDIARRFTPGLITLFFK